jgi:hypothetical protein
MDKMITYCFRFVNIEFELLQKIFSCFFGILYKFFLFWKK